MTILNYLKCKSNRVPLMLCVALTLSACATNDDNATANNMANNMANKAEPSQTDKSLSVTQFIAQFNTLQDTLDLAQRQYLRHSSTNSDGNTFKAWRCWDKHWGDDCPDVSNAQDTNTYTLHIADSNNDGREDYCLLVEEVNITSDTILGFYEKGQSGLKLLPLNSAIEQLYDEKKAQQWHRNVGTPFIQYSNGVYTLNFHDSVMKNQAGETIFKGQIESLDYWEESKYQYLWRDDTLTLINTHVEKIYPDSDGP